MTDSIGAAVDLGSNSVHLLVARIRRGRTGESLVDESTFLGLGDHVRVHGELGSEVRAATVETVVGYAQIAADHGAGAPTFLGTEPIRRASDRSLLADEIKAATGFPLHVLAHEDEAYLTVIGVTSGRPLARETLVVDIGGGSSEFCLVGPDRLPQAVGLRLGGATLTARHVHHDPPSRAEVDAMVAEAAVILEDAPASVGVELVAVGGTASNLVKLDPAAVATAGGLTLALIADARRILEDHTATDLVERFAVKLVRARLLPSGAAIAQALLARSGGAAIRVSDAGIREGAVLAVCHAGPDWREDLPALAQGW